MTFIDTIKEKAKQNVKTILLPESSDERICNAAIIVQKEGIANIIFIGKPVINCENIEYIIPQESQYFNKFVNDLYELRKVKGMTIEKAKELISNNVYFATMMLREGFADGLVSGAIHTTADTLRPALQIIKAKEGIKTVSTFFIVEVPNCEYGENGLFLFSDCALIENPSSEQLSDIAIASNSSFLNLIGKTSKIAMLSYSTKGSADSEQTQKVITATKIVKQKNPEILIDGELQLDAAIVEKVAKLKSPTSTIAGNANILVFPDLNSGNIGYKLVQRLAKAKVYGPITQGLNKPVNDLSRGCNVEEIVGTIAITAVLN